MKQIIETIATLRNQREAQGYGTTEYDSMIAMIAALMAMQEEFAPLAAEAAPERLSLMAMQEEFATLTAQALPQAPELRPNHGLLGLRQRLITEEYAELLQAVAHYRTSGKVANIANVAKEAADLIYVVAGLCASFGIDIDAVLAAVHASNMTKRGAGMEDGKLLKGASYEPPNIVDILTAHHAPF